MKRLIAIVSIATASLVFTGQADAATCRRAGASLFDPPRLNADGSVVAFATNASLDRADTNATLDVYTRDLPTGTVELISARSDGRAGDGRAGWPSISGDARFVAFESDAKRLTPGDDAVGRTDVFVRDRRARTTTLVSMGPRGRSGDAASSHPDISTDGRRVAFQSFAADLAGKDRNNLSDVFVRDLITKKTKLVSALPGRRPAEQLGSTTPSIGAGAVAFDSTEAFVEPGSDPQSQVKSSAFYEHNIVVYDLTTGKTRVANLPPGGSAQDGLSYRPDVSADGRYVAFESSSTNLVDGDQNNTPGLRGIIEPDVFVTDLRTGKIRRVSVASDGAESNGSGSSGPSISSNGARVAFESGASNLEAGDTNSALDVFVHKTSAARTMRVSTDRRGGDPGSAGYLSFGSVSAGVSPDGGTVAFVSSAPDLVGPRRGPLLFGVFVRAVDGARSFSTPIGLGCRTRVPTPAPSKASMAPLPLLVLIGCSIGVARRRKRAGLIAAMSAVVVLVSSAPATAHHYAPIQPGGPILTEDDPNGGVGSTDFVFRDRTTKELYIGTAAHVVRAYPTGGPRGIGARVPIDGLGNFGTIAYSREGSNSFSRQDFALIKIDKRNYQKTDPAVRTWGGPTGTADPSTLVPGFPTFQYGQSVYTRHNQATRAKRGVFKRVIDDDWGWQGWYLHTSWTYGGDSGSPILYGPEGEALGITSLTAAPFAEPGWVMGPTVYLVLQELALGGFDVELVTAPFHGVTGDVEGTAQHCAGQPLGETAQNDGCVRPSTDP